MWNFGINVNLLLSQLWPRFQLSGRAVADLNNAIVHGGYSIKLNYRTQIIL